MDTGAVILCGGKSRRMGQPKAWLTLGEWPMLEHVVRQVTQVATPAVVVAAAGQALPQLSQPVDIVRDRVPGRGPLEGLYCGLNHLRTRCAVAVVTACDVPLVQPALLQRLVDLLDKHEVVVPVEEGRRHSLTAVYRTSVVERMDELLEQGQRKLRCLHDQCDTRLIDVRQLRDVDPELVSLLNVNRPADCLQVCQWMEQQARGRVADPDTQ